MRVRRLRVVHPGQIRRMGDDRSAMPGGTEGAKPRFHGLGLDAVRTCESRSGKRITHSSSRRVRPVGARQIRHVCEGHRRTSAVLHESAVDEKSLNNAELRHRRGTERHADGTRSLDDVRVLHHGLDGTIRCRVNARLHRILVHASLIRRVGLNATVPVQVIRVHIQTHRRQRRDRVGRV